METQPQRERFQMSGIIINVADRLPLCNATLVGFICLLPYLILSTFYINYEFSSGKTVFSSRVSSKQSTEIEEGNLRAVKLKGTPDQTGFH